MTALAVLGPTASGKSEVALALAEALGGTVLSVDSMQVYRGMDVGTAKPGPEERARVPHRLLDLVEPEQPFTVADYQEAGRTEIAAAVAAGSTPVLAGGSGLHFRALVDPLTFPPFDLGVRRRLEVLEPDAARRRLLEADPAAGDHVQLDNPRRVVRALEVLELTGQSPSRRAARPEAEAVRRYRARFPFVAVGLDAGEELERRVGARLDRMVEEGLVEEVAGLRGRLGPTARQAVGYKELMPVVEGRISLEEGLADARRATLELARRQRSYFRRDPRIHWVRWRPDPDALVSAARDRLEEVMAWSS